jgi:hypothetical protein
MNFRITVLAIMALAISLPLAAAQNRPGEPVDGQATGGAYPQGAQAGIPVPPELTLPAGTLITVRNTQPLSSDRNAPGDSFAALLEQPLVAQGWVTARRGQVAEGRVAIAQKAGRVQGVSQLAVELNELTLVDGQQVPIRTELMQVSAGTSHERDVAEIGTSTGIGSIIGAAAGGGTGAAIGAAVGAAAGVTGVLSTRGRATEIYPESILTFRLEEPVSFSTEQAQQAFLPVTERDYARQPARASYRAGAAPYPAREAYPPPPYYPTPYYYPGYYPPPYGYGYYGYGPGFGIIVGPRIYRPYPRFFIGGRIRRR